MTNGEKRDYFVNRAAAWRGMHEMMSAMYRAGVGDDTLQSIEADIRPRVSEALRAVELTWPAEFGPVECD